MYQSRRASALPMQYLVAIIIAAFSLIVLLVLINTFSDTDYTRSIQQCAYLFTEAGHPMNKAGLTGAKLDRVSSAMEQLLRTNCHSITYEITNSDLSSLRNLITECWRKTNQGDDILGPFSEGKALYLYCGSVVAEQGVRDFDSKLSDALSDEETRALLLNASGTRNLNGYLLYEQSDFPSRLDAGEEFVVVFSISKPNLDCSSIDECYQAVGNSVLKGVASIGSPVSTLVSYLSSAPETSYTGIIARPLGSQGENFCSITGSPENCEGQLIIPSTHHER